MTTFRELSFVNGKLLQTQIKELGKLRTESISITEDEASYDFKKKAFELNDNYHPCHLLSPYTNPLNIMIYLWKSGFNRAKSQARLKYEESRQGFGCKQYLKALFVGAWTSVQLFFIFQKRLRD